MTRLSEQRRSLNFRLPAGGTAWPRLFALTDDRRTTDLQQLIAKLPAGCGLVFRHYDAPERARLARSVVRMCRARHISCFIAGNVRLALASGADGVHLPEHQLKRLPPGLATLRQRGGRVTAAAHSARALHLAHRRKVDGAFVSPVFATRSHPGKRPLGVLRFARLARRQGLVIYALGGQRLQSARRVRRAGAYGLAGIDLFDGF